MPLYLLPDGLLQYGYHRWAHENPFLWKLHRAHYQAEEMGFFVSYRNAGLYYLLMPNGSHHGTKEKPLLFEAKRTGKVRLRNCKLTQKGPFCDNSHIILKKS